MLTLRRLSSVLAVALVVVPLLGSPAWADPCPVTPSEYWKNVIEFPDEPFRVLGDSTATPDWVKFTILLCDPEHVYFQDSNHYTFHYDFATNELDPLVGMSLEEFNNATLYEDGQEAILGAVLMPASWIWPQPPQIQEYGIQFVRQDAYTPDEIINMFQLVTSAVTADPDVQAFYFPTYEQMEVAEENQAYLASHGVAVSSISRWADGNACYSEGWGIGTLKYFAGDEIEDAYISGELEPGDVLITDGVPAEVPFVAGIITLTPSTPNSHVAILAQTFNVPFVHLALAEDVEWAQALLGHKIAIRVYNEADRCDVRLHDLDGVINDETIAEILELKELPPLNISPTQPYGAYSANTDGLHLSDIQYFGGKASNYGFLRRTIPGNSRVATAFSFDLWNAFLDQTIASGNTLRQEIDQILGGYTFPPNMLELSEDLDTVRDMFKHDDETVFSQALQDAIIATLTDPQYGFDPYQKIRFRSSTNMEDSEQFTGAGLYDSKSGCLADDLDGDDEGPSWCDPDEEDERGVFRAIRRVFRTFYNDNAYLERLRWGVDEHDVGMALLVHHSFPDPIEMANGVATFNESDYPDALLVSQLGAVSVANPEDGAIPEEANVIIRTSHTWVDVLRYSSLVQWGDTVMTLPDDYVAFGGLMADVADAYGAEIGESEFVLDFEYKKIAPDGDLIIKQVRKLPQPDTAPSIVPFLLDEPVEYCTYQGEYADVFANHRLKTRLRLNTDNLWMTEENLEACFVTDAAMEYTDGCFVLDHEDDLASYPEASHDYKEADFYTIDEWVFDDLANARSYALRTDRAGELVSSAESPIWTIADLGVPYPFFPFNTLELHVKYDQDVPSWVNGEVVMTDNDSVLLAPCPEERWDDLLREYSITDDGVTVDVSFYHPLGSAPCAYTAPMVRWVETRIRGLISQDIVLHDWYAQTYRPEHHNFGEHFIFEPRLEPGIDPSILLELEDKNIQYIHAYKPHASQPAFVKTYKGDDCGDAHCLTNEDCDDLDGRQFCSKDLADCDGVGLCTDVPNECLPIVHPVCGCDGRNYPNECYASMAGVSVEHDGPCTQRCGPLSRQACPSGEYCMYPVGECDHGIQGVCTRIPEQWECPRLYDPVCGCDGRTYTNECYVRKAGESIKYWGPCEKTGACCLVDGDCIDTTAEKCYDICGEFRGEGTSCRTTADIRELPRQDGIGLVGIEPDAIRRPCPVQHVPYGACCLPGGDCVETYECDCKRIQGGVYMGDDTVCQLGTCVVCGGIAGVPCRSEHEFCKYPDSTCHLVDHQGVCMEIPTCLLTLWDPVCGCDGHTYGNECLADHAGEPIDYYGECELEE